MIPPTWMIEDIERRRREREEQDRPQLWIDAPLPTAPVARERSENDSPRGPIVIDLW